MLDEVPGWFARAVKVPFASRKVTVAGSAIHYLAWGDDESKPGLVLVHGNGAHAHWWSFLAPFFLEDYRVVAIDLSGAGDSDHRDHYTPEQFADEVLSVDRKSVV